MWIAVRCVRFCSFDLRTSYVREIDLVEGRRATYRWGGHQTHILKYTVPESTAEEPINSFSVMLQPEGDYQHLQVFISYGKFVGRFYTIFSSFYNNFFYSRLFMTQKWVIYYLL